MLGAKLGGLCRYGFRALTGIRALQAHRFLAVVVARLRMALWRFHWRRLYPAYADMWNCSIRLGRINEIARHVDRVPHAELLAGRNRLADMDEAQLVGFYELEDCQDEPFRWSHPVAVLRFALSPQPCEITLELMPVRPRQMPTCIELFFDGRPVEIVNRDEQTLVVRCHLMPEDFRAESAVHDLTVLCNPFRPRQHETESNDPRALGLPIHALQLAPSPVNPV